MTTHPRPDAAPGAPVDRVQLSRGVNRWRRRRRDELNRTRPGMLREHPPVAPASLSPDQSLEHLWDRHGKCVYALACTLLGDERAATRAVTLAMRDLAGSPEVVPAEEGLRAMARQVYLRTQELSGETPRTLHLPPAMVWLGDLAQLQRGCLALCVFGGHTHREAARLLGVPPTTVAELLTMGLRELGRLRSGGAAASV